MSAQNRRTYWEDTCSPDSFPALNGDLDVDVAIVGGGIVGIAAARMIKDAGMTAAVVEARRVGQGVSGKATAKVTSQHGLRYRTIEKKFGEDKARLYADAQETGLRRIVELSRTYGFDADIETVPAYVYTREEGHVEEIEKEVELARRLGLPASVTRDTGLPFDVKAAMRWDDQAQFHPIKFVAGLAQTITGDGSHVFENSRVTDWDPKREVTDRGTVKGSATRLLYRGRRVGAFDPHPPLERSHPCSVRR
ncbi:MAG TPA: FAD-dependent oxidoreductase, partial [Sphingomicrobium sp.]|nr:FAD-dependent oxidoreductase [Sphingomicrobium sp.]